MKTKNAFEKFTAAIRASGLVHAEPAEEESGVRIVIPLNDANRAALAALERKWRARRPLTEANAVKRVLNQASLPRTHFARVSEEGF